MAAAPRAYALSEMAILVEFFMRFSLFRPFAERVERFRVLGRGRERPFSATSWR